MLTMARQRRGSVRNKQGKAYELTGDEAKFTTEIQRVTEKIETLEGLRVQSARQIEANEQRDADLSGVMAFCELASKNLAEFSFEDKRVALEALQIKVWAEDGRLTIEGAIPEANAAIESTTLSPSDNPVAT